MITAFRLQPVGFVVESLALDKRAWQAGRRAAGVSG